jgi:phage gpG-like protein
MKRIKSINQEILRKIEIGIKKSGFHVQSEVQESIAGRRAEPKSVDTGRFLNSIKTTFPKKFEAQVETNVEYADILEYGTSTRQPRNHFKNTASREKNKVIQIIKQEIKT